MFSLSIIIPSYNRASLVEQTLHALTRQTRTDFQVILVDHGSTDNTGAVVQKYKDLLQLSYYSITRDSYSASIPRDFGVQRAEASLIAFIDSGTVVPSWYVDAHVLFHHLHPNSVGVGMQYRNDHFEENTAALEALDFTNLDQALPALKEAQFTDVRAGLELETSPMPWLFGWTANLSLSTEAYFAAGGFDQDLHGWGFEDCDLCYRIFKQGLGFSFIEDGWSVEIPQPREGIQKRMESDQKNTRLCYTKQRGLGLEALLLSAMLLQELIQFYKTKLDGATLKARIHERKHASRPHQKTEELFCYLAQLGQEMKKTVAPVTLSEEVRAHLAQPTLLIGGIPQDTEWYDYVTLVDESTISTPSLWSCCGILIPVADQALGTVVVSDLWKKLDWSFFPPSEVVDPPLLEILLSEIQRTARQAVFLDSPSIPSNISVETLVRLCGKHNLAFQIVSLESLNIKATKV